MHGPGKKLRPLVFAHVFVHTENRPLCSPCLPVSVFPDVAGSAEPAAGVVCSGEAEAREDHQRGPEADTGAVSGAGRVSAGRHQDRQSGADRTVVEGDRDRVLPRREPVQHLLMQRDHGAALFGLVVLLNQGGGVLGKNGAVDRHAAFAAVSEVLEAGLVLRVALYPDGQVAIAALQPGGISALDYRVKDLFEGRGYRDTRRRHHKTVQVWIILIRIHIDGRPGGRDGQRRKLGTLIRRDRQGDGVPRRRGSRCRGDCAAGHGSIDHDAIELPRVRYFQAVRSVVRHCGRQRVCRSVFRDRDDHIMSCRVIGHAGLAAVCLGDRVLIAT